MDRKGLKSMLKVVSFNIRNDRAIADGRNYWFFRRRRVVKMLRALNADVIGLQEVRPWALRNLKLSLPDYRVVSFGRDNGRKRGEHCSVFVRRTRFDVQEAICHWFSATPNKPGSRDSEARVPRIATILTLVDNEDDSQLHIVNLHIDADSGNARKRSLDQLRVHLEQVAIPIIVLGDFNDLFDQPCFAPLREIEMRDALGLIPVVGPESATYHGFRGRHDGARIDYILVSKDFEVVDGAIVHSAVGERVASDHWPIVARLRRL